MERRPRSLAAHESTNHVRREREVGSFWLEAPWGHRSSFGSFSPRAPQAVRVERRLVWRAAVPTKGPTQVMFETVGAGARKSVSFFDLLGWTVVAHERLRSRWTYFRRSRNVWHRSNRALLSWEKSPKFRSACLGSAAARSHSTSTGLAPQQPISLAPEKELDGAVPCCSGSHRCTELPAVSLLLRRPAGNWLLSQLAAHTTSTTPNRGGWRGRDSAD